MKTFFIIVAGLFSCQLFAQANICSSATVLPVGNTCNYTPYTFNSSFTSEIGAPGCSACSRDAWFSITAVSGHTTVAATAANNYVNISLTAYSGTCGSLTQVACINTNGAGGSEYLTFATSVGQTYYIRLCRVNGNCSALESFMGCSDNTSGNICVIRSSAPTNNINCNQSVTICSSAGLASNNTGFGTQDLNSGNKGCLTNLEHQSNWYAFSPVSTGTIAFTINPLSNIDYDFAIWGPMNAFACPVSASPLRCSYAAPGGSSPTGLAAGAGDNSEDQYGNGFVEPITVGPGQVNKVYIMLIDNWTSNGVPFTLTWNLTGGVSLDCTPLPVALLQFTGSEESSFNLIKWTTATEVNNAYFIVEKSNDANTWKELGRVDGAGNSNEMLDYSITDPVPFQTTYYRLVQYDFDGKKTEFEPISVQRSSGLASGGEVFSFYPNPVTNLINIQTYYDGENLISITDQNGKTVLTSQVQGITSVALEISGIPNGLYFMTVDNKGKVQHEKLIVRN